MKPWSGEDILLPAWVTNEDPKTFNTSIAHIFRAGFRDLAPRPLWGACGEVRYMQPPNNLFRFARRMLRYLR